MIPQELWEKILRSIPIVVVSIAVKKPSGAMLIVKRSIKPLEGYWTLPGGRVEMYERPCQTAIRELREETGILADRAFFIGIDHLEIPERQCEELVYLVRVSAGCRVVLNNEASEYLWVWPSDYPTPMHEVTKREIEMAELYGG